MANDAKQSHVIAYIRHIGVHNMCEKRAYGADGVLPPGVENGNKRYIMKADDSDGTASYRTDTDAQRLLMNDDDDTCAEAFESAEHVPVRDGCEAVRDTDDRMPVGDA